MVGSKGRVVEAAGSAQEEERRGMEREVGRRGGRGQGKYFTQWRSTDPERRDGVEAMRI